MTRTEANIEDFIGKEFIRVEATPSHDELLFYMHDGSYFRMYHEQDCCEHVRMVDFDDVDIDCLIKTPVYNACIGTNVNEDEDDDGYDSFTWTFYNIDTIKGYTQIRWLGTSNGYYSERVDIELITP